MEGLLSCTPFTNVPYLTPKMAYFSAILNLLMVLWPDVKPSEESFGRGQAVCYQTRGQFEYRICRPPLRLPTPLMILLKEACVHRRALGLMLGCPEVRYITEGR